MSHRQTSDARQAAYTAAARDSLHQARRQMLDSLAHICRSTAGQPLPADVASLAAYVLGITTQVTAAVAPAEDLAVVLVQTAPCDLPDGTYGLCWRCERQTAIEWSGPTPVGYETAPMYLCEPCRRRLAALAHGSLRHRDRAQL